MRKFTEQKLVLASHNKGKLAEISAMLKPYNIDVVLAGDLGLPEPAETENTFIGNALIKARAAATASGLPALSDDSGLSVTALNGDPGVYSADWGGPSKDFNMAMQRIQNELGAATDRSAWFTCVLALCWPDGETATVEGRIDGDIVWPPRGTEGHGYDPVFRPEGESRTFAEMTQQEKAAHSHRGRAFEKLIRDVLT